MMGGPLGYLDDGARSRALYFYLHRNSFRVVKDCVACRAPCWSWLDDKTRCDYISYSFCKHYRENNIELFF